MGGENSLFAQVRTWLELGYFLSQILIFVVAVFAAIAGYKQLKTFKHFEVLKYIEDRNFREARRIVIRDVEPRRNISWSDREYAALESAAATVCATYDIVAILMKNDGWNGSMSIKSVPKFWRFFIENWAVSIQRTHLILEGYIKHRREVGNSRAYENFDQLAEISCVLFPYEHKAISKRCESLKSLE